MKKTYILPLLVAGLLASSCSNENPFSGESGEGQVLKSALAVDIDADGLVRHNAPTRADADVDDFTVVFTKVGEAQPMAKYRYAEMPEVVTLQAGSYTCTATYGENRPAEWESPYFLGVSQQFDVNAYEITSYIEPIVCHLENIKVTVDFDKSLRKVMSNDSFVEVKVGSSDALSFGILEADSQKAGYFMHSDEITLVAVFHGVVDGQNLVETKSLRDIQKGNHYKINFKLHGGAESDPTGDADADVSIDASVTVVDVTRNITLGDEPLLNEEGDRPHEGGGEVTPPEPEEPVAPAITAEAPVNLEIVNDGKSLSTCVINIHSSAKGGIQAFTCDIESDALTADELEGFGLAQHLDLVNTPAEMQGILTNLGFPILVGGKTDARFEITPFLNLLSDLGEYEHHFVITVTDANGTTVKTLKIKY